MCKHSLTQSECFFTLEALFVLLPCKRPERTDAFIVKTFYRIRTAFPMKIYLLLSPSFR